MRTCRRSVAAMNTRFDVFLHDSKADYDEQHLEAVATAVLEEIARLDGTLSRFDPRGEIARVNREAENRFVRVDRELFALLEACEQARQLTNGYFDVTRGGGWELDAASCSVRLAVDARIDLGGVGKGYALDYGREILRRFNVESGLLQGGTSSVLAIGNEVWPIDVRHPLDPNRIVQRIELANCGLSCSAARNTELPVSDVVNPLTGAPLADNGACVVLAANATEAEFFSTALLAMGKETAKHYLENTELIVGWIDSEFSWLKNQ
ncbi:MAG TPA: FAD:protein FMN transferase [Blastocatellia bacterium]|nr:FAD:protein FMN transferase [Blastocatellia bacterium]HMV84581.1 FAD:protein FMN transferase [Blastocatellia bacterium]HMY70753.1 FAD:protein FMN transferase [Blastocatellia bacterium]HMZ18144.1 FAD:protein FMN transferase [Blastocatellia bacterium]HNG31369.1 FAD:protein FMN transferase [Blastocatellia bacterium]